MRVKIIKVLNAEIECNFAKSLTELEFSKHFLPIFQSRTKEAYVKFHEEYAKIGGTAEKDADIKSGKRSKAEGDDRLHNKA